MALRLFITIFSLVPILSFSQTRMDDSLILVDLYNQLDGPNWINSENWLTSAQLENWNGITTHADRVTTVNLTNRGISGNFPEMVYQLDALEVLKFFTGDLLGSLSDNIYQLTNLRELTIANCGISGVIPSRLDSLPQLERIDLNRNNLEGILPSLPSQIQKVDLRQNNFSGIIPPEYADLPIWQIDISNNNLSGSLDIVSNWKELDGFKGSFNDWDQQTLPDWLDEMPVLRSFVCSSCNLTGELPEYDWSGSPSFYQLIVASNSLSGNLENLPLDMAGNNYPWLDLTENDFSGILSTDKIKAVNRLWLNNNDIEGITTFEYEYLASLRLANNKLLLSAILEEFPTIVNDKGISNYRIENQRSPFEDEMLVITEGDDLVLLADESVDGASYQWYYNFNALEGQNEETLNIPTIEFSQSGRYWCEISHPSIVDTNEEVVPFKGKEWTVDVQSTTHINETLDDIVVFPNPVSNDIHINVDGKRANYQLIDLQGVILLSGSISGHIALNVEALSSGMYILQLSTGLETNSYQLIKL